MTDTIKTDAVGNARKISGRQAALLGIGGVLGTIALLESAVFSGNLEAFWAVLRGGQLFPVERSSISSAEAAAEVVWIVVALVALACVAAAGRREAGLAWGSAARQVRLLGEWMLVLGVVMAVALPVLRQFLYALEGRGFGSSNLDVEAVPTWFLVLKSVNAGITEEIIVVAIAWRLLELIPTRAGKPAFVMTAAATAILVALRVSYHLYLGIPVLYVIALGWLTVLFYRHTRSLGTLIVAHIAWDLLEHTTAIPAGSMYVILGIACVWVFTAGPAPLGQHFGFTYDQQPPDLAGHSPYRFVTARESKPVRQDSQP